LRVPVPLVASPSSFAVALLLQAMLMGCLFLLGLLNAIGAVFGDVGIGTRGRFLSNSPDHVGIGTRGRLLSHSPEHVVCPSGYVDHTQGKAFHWECAQECPGKWAWAGADISCMCACVLPKECVSSTVADPCVTRWELENVGNKVLETRVVTPAPALLWPSPAPYALPKLPAAIPTSAPIDYRKQVGEPRTVATTIAPTPEDSTGLIVIISSVGVALVAGVCVISCCI